MSRDEINRLLAEKVMGWHIVNVSTLPYDPMYTHAYDTWVDEYGVTCCAPAVAWNPLDNIAQAMMVAEKIIAMGYAFSLNYFRVGGWRAFFEDGSSAYRSDANAIPTLAICEAALRVVEND